MNTSARLLIAPATMRRMAMQNSSANAASRNYFKFEYPHSFRGTNNAYNNIPVKR